MRSQVLAGAALSRSFAMEDDGESIRQRTVVGCSMRSLLPLVKEIPVNPVPTHEIDKRSSLCQQDSRTTGATSGQDRSTDRVRGNVYWFDVLAE